MSHNHHALDLDQTAALATQIRVDSVRATTAAGSGHATSALSMADLLAVLIGRHLRYRIDAPKDPANDRLVLSKGHAAPAIYAALKATGALSDDELLSLRSAGSRLQGHPMPGDLPLIDVATGSLGQGLPVGVGMALGLRRLGSPARTFVILGDSEMSEGSVWEAIAFAGHQRLPGLVGVLDMNRLGQRGPTMLEWDTEAYVRRVEAFGWAAYPADGHDLASIDAALDDAAGEDRPALVVARTVKGKGVSFLEDVEGMHGKALDAEKRDRALAELGSTDSPVFTMAAPPEFTTGRERPASSSPPRFTEATATRDAFGKALAAEVAARPDLIVLDAEVSDSTRTEAVSEVGGDLVQLYIAEQNMIGVANGLAAVGFRPVAATFAAFLTRAHDFIRMAAMGGARMVLCGSHAGVEIGADGPSQMGLEDLAMMRGLPGSAVTYPADGNATVALFGELLDHDGVGYLRTTRGETPRLYGPDETFPIGGSKQHRTGDHDHVTLVGAGVTLFEALKASDELAEKGIRARVIDVYSVAPIDAEALRRALDETGHMVVVEDHRRAGGIGEAVLSAVGGEATGRIGHLAVEGVPGSATRDEQLRQAGISAEAIVAEAERILDGDREGASPSASSAEGEILAGERRSG